MPIQSDHDQYSDKEAQRRFEAALCGARIVGHKPQSEMKLGKPRGKRVASPKKFERPRTKK
jgi:hypothetical protein